MNISCDRIRRLLGGMFSAGILLVHGGVEGADANDVVVTVDRTTRAWSDLAMGAPSSEDDADQSLGTKAVLHPMQPSGTDRASLPFELPRGAQMKIEHADR